MISEAVVLWLLIGISLLEARIESVFFAGGQPSAGLVPNILIKPDNKPTDIAERTPSQNSSQEKRSIHFPLKLVINDVLKPLSSQQLRLCDFKKSISDESRKDLPLNIQSLTSFLGNQNQLSNFISGYEGNLTDIIGALAENLSHSISRVVDDSKLIPERRLEEGSLASDYTASPSLNIHKLSNPSHLANCDYQEISKGFMMSKNSSTPNNSYNCCYCNQPVTVGGKKSGSMYVTPMMEVNAQPVNVPVQPVVVPAATYPPPMNYSTQSASSMAGYYNFLYPTTTANPKTNVSQSQNKLVEPNKGLKFGTVKSLQAAEQIIKSLLFAGLLPEKTFTTQESYPNSVENEQSSQFTSQVFQNSSFNDINRNNTNLVNNVNQTANTTETNYNSSIIPNPIDKMYVEDVSNISNRSEYGGEMMTKMVTQMTIRMRKVTENPEAHRSLKEGLIKPVNDTWRLAVITQPTNLIASTQTPMENPDKNDSTNKTDAVQLLGAYNTLCQKLASKAGWSFDKRIRLLSALLHSQDDAIRVQSYPNSYSVYPLYSLYPIIPLNSLISSNFTNSSTALNVIS